MRVISGTARGRKLLSPDGQDVRPTLDRVKESVFSSLYPYLNDAVVLDLFCGSGGLGIEALSRGAMHCDFVDASRASVTTTKKNLELTRLNGKADVILSDFKAHLAKTNKKYTLVLLDPPYSMGIEDKVMELLPSVTKPDTIVMLETEYTPGDYHDFEMIRQAKYGRVYITLYKRI